MYIHVRKTLVYIYTNICVCIYTYVNIYIHTYTYVYIHIYIYMLMYTLTFIRHTATRCNALQHHCTTRRRMGFSSPFSAKQKKILVSSGQFAESHYVRVAACCRVFYTQYLVCGKSQLGHPMSVSAIFQDKIMNKVISTTSSGAPSAIQRMRQFIAVRHLDCALQCVAVC